LVAGPFHFIFEQQNGRKETEIHSMMGGRDLMDLPNPQGIGQVRDEDDKKEQKIEK
jgi:hypothetical protein